MDTATFVVLGAVTTVAFGFAMAAMAIGVMFRRKCLRGSCGGPVARDTSGEVISCRDCPNRGRRQ